MSKDLTDKQLDSMDEIDMQSYMDDAMEFRAKQKPKYQGVCKGCGEFENIRDRSVYQEIYDKIFCYSCDAWSELIERRHFGKKPEDFDEYGELKNKYCSYTGRLRSNRCCKNVNCGKDVDNFPSEEDVKGMVRQWNCDKIIEILDGVEGLCQDEFDKLQDFLNKVKQGGI